MIRFEQRQTADRYSEHLEEVFSDVHCFRSVLHLSSALYSLLSALQSLPWQHDIPSESVKDVMRFAAVAMEVCTGLLSSTTVLSLITTTVVIYSRQGMEHGHSSNIVHLLLRNWVKHKAWKVEGIRQRDARKRPGEIVLRMIWKV